jgi:hypothetical protein
MKIQLCTLKAPADCEYRIDGKISHVFLCGEKLYCQYKQVIETVFSSDDSDYEKCLNATNEISAINNATDE